MDVCDTENSVDNLGHQIPVEIPTNVTTEPVTEPSFDLFKVLDDYLGILH